MMTTGSRNPDCRVNDAMHIVCNWSDFFAFIVGYLIKDEKNNDLSSPKISWIASLSN